MSITLNIKRIRNKYDLNLNSIVETSPSSIFYDGFKLNTIDNCNVIIEVIPLKFNINKSFLDKIKENKYIINCIDIIYDFNNIYIIYENYKIYNKLNITNITTNICFNNFFNQFRDLIIFLIDNNFDIEPIQLSDIYIKNDNIYVMIKQIKKNNKIIKTGSPIYSPPEIFNQKNLYLYDKLIWNFGILIYEIIYKETPYKLCKDINQIKFSMKNLTFDDNDILKLFLSYDITNRIIYKDFISLDISKFNIFNFSNDKIKINDNNNNDNNNNNNNDNNNNNNNNDNNNDNDNDITIDENKDGTFFIMED
jgi:hypothetical protein